MDKIVHLNVRQLKEELESRNLSTKGNKSKLQARLLKSMENNGENDENNKCSDAPLTTEDEQQALIVSNDNAQTSTHLRMNALFTDIAGVQNRLMETIETQVMGMHQHMENNVVKSSNVLMESLRNNSIQLEERILDSVLKMEGRAYADLARLRESLTVNLKNMEDKLKCIEELTVHLKERQDNFEGELQNSYPEIKNKFKAADENVERSKADKNDCKCQILYNNPTIVSDTLRLNLPTFDGTKPFSIFKLQFEMCVKLYKWNDEEKLAALILALKGSSTSILQSFANTTNLNYETVMAALEKQYDSEHWRQICNVQLVSRVQKPDEAILDYANEIERLTNLAYSNSSNDFLEITKIQNFIRGLHDCDVKLAMYMTPKPSFIETLAYAITQPLHLAKSKHNRDDNRE